MALFNYECDEVKHIIDEVSPNYPQLTTYEKEWLFFHKYHYIPGIPVELEYETVSVNPTGMVSNAIPYQYKSAILKGQTLVNLLSESNINVKSSNTYRINYTHDLNTTKTYILQYRINQIPELSDTTDSARLLKFEWYNGNKYGGYSDIFIRDITVGNDNFIMINPFNNEVTKTYFGIWCPNYVSGSLDMDIILIEYQNSMENRNISYFTGIQSVRMPVLTTSNEDGTKTNILTVNEDVTLRSSGDICDELNLLTRQLTQRIGEDGVVLSQEVVKTVDLSSNKVYAYNGTTHYTCSSEEGSLIPTACIEVPVETETVE